MVSWRFSCLFLTLLPVFCKAESEENFHELVMRDNVTAVAEALENGADPNGKNRYGVLPLGLACANGSEPVVRMLLSHGADVTAILADGETPIMIAARTGRPEIISLLLDSGAAHESVGKSGQDALMWAAAEGHAEAVRVLIDAGANPDRVLDSGFTALLFAARNGHSEVVGELLRAGAEVDHKIKEKVNRRKSPPKGTTALVLAVENGHYSLAEILLEAGADPNDQSTGFAILHSLSRIRKPDRGDGDNGLPPPKGSGIVTSLTFAKKLIEEYGADVNAVLKNGSAGGPRFGYRGATPFLLASKRCDLDYMKLLERHGADLSITNEDGTTALMAAAGVGSHAPEEEAGTEPEALEVTAWLLAKGQDVNAVNRNRETAMHGAAYKNRPELVRFLAQSGADIGVWNQRNKHRWTPLLIAQGFRPGNFKPSFETIEAFEEVMEEEGIEPPAAPKRPVVGKPKKYEP